MFKLTKLLQWFFGSAVLLGPWSAMITSGIAIGTGLPFFLAGIVANVVMFLPFYLIVAFGLFSVAVVLWRTYHFNDCQAAALELQEEIKQAKEDLARKGFNFN